MKRIDKKVSNFSGNKLTVSVFGASHDEKIGVTVSGLNKGDKIDEEILQKFLDRRKPSASAFSPPQSQPDGANCRAGNGILLNISQGSSAQPAASQHSLVGMA